VTDATPGKPLGDVHVLQSRIRPRLTDLAEGKFGRLFPELPAEPSTDDALLKLGAVGGPLEAVSEVPDDADNPGIPAGWAFFGQFIAHDITHDRTPLGHREDLTVIQNARAPWLDLECIYGAGPVGQPYLYDMSDGDKLLVGRAGRDIPRNHQGRGLVADGRNDTQVFISQLHLALLHFHNRVVDYVRERGFTGDDVLPEAQRLTRWHYQWITIHEYLPLTVGADLMEDIAINGPRVCVFAARPFIPVEFSDGAFRFGHSQVRATYDLNPNALAMPLFPDLVSSRAIDDDLTVEWWRLFEIPDHGAPQASRRITARLTPSLLRLPEQLVGVVPRPEFSSLASRDLERGRSVDLPSGEAVARELGLTPCTENELGLVDAGWEGETPLWLYVLLEAERERDGLTLGAVGGRIVAEVLLGLIDNDPKSYRRALTEWSPELPSETAGQFTMADLLQFAGVI
jgi:hypothetical protein